MSYGALYPNIFKDKVNVLCCFEFLNTTPTYVVTHDFEQNMKLLAWVPVSPASTELQVSTITFEK